MATITSAGSGNWWTAGTWDLTRAPAAGDAVVIATGHTIVWNVANGVTIPATGTLASITAQGTGTISLAMAGTASYALNATTLQAGATAALITVSGAAAGATLTITCTNLTGGSGNLAIGVQCSTTGTVNIVGNVTGGSGANNAWGVYGASSGPINIGTVGVPTTITGGSNPVLGMGVYNQSTSTVTVIGNVIGGGAGTYGIYNYATGAINVTGNVTGGTGQTGMGIFNNSTGVVTITGNLIWSASEGPLRGKNFVYTPAAGNYILVTPAGTKCAPEVAAASLLSGATNGTVTGTLARPRLVGSGGLAG